MMVNGDRCTLGGKAKRGGGTDVASRTRDERNLAVETAPMIGHGMGSAIVGRAGRRYQMVQPPSTRISAPVMKAASSEARKRTA